MNIQTKYHGERIIEKDHIWHFATGIPGFKDENQFIIIQLEENSVFYVLQSIKTSSLGFIIVNPFIYFKDYDFQLEENVLEQLEIEKEEDVQVYTILTVKDPFQQTTANLQAPIIVNSKNNQAKQVILNNTNYQTRHLLFPSTEEIKG